MFLWNALLRGRHIQTRFDFMPALQTIFSHEANLDTAIDNMQQTNLSASTVRHRDM